MAGRVQRRGPNSVTPSEAGNLETCQYSELGVCIRALVQRLEAGDKKNFKIWDLSREFNIKRRRLYDILNVFEAVGCCSKADIDEILWLGTGTVAGVIRSLASDKRIKNIEVRLGDIFPVPCSVGVSNLATCFLTMFFAVNRSVLNVKVLGQFLSRDTGRFKQTRYKLYLISYILSAIDVLERKAASHEVELLQPFAASLADEGYSDPLSVRSLLNHTSMSSSMDIFESRIRELDDSAAQVAEL